MSEFKMIFNVPRQDKQQEIKHPDTQLTLKMPATIMMVNYHFTAILMISGDRAPGYLLQTQMS